jgi:hypothetical protein
LGETRTDCPHEGHDSTVLRHQADAQRRVIAGLEIRPVHRQNEYLWLRSAPEQTLNENLFDDFTSTFIS